MKAPFPFFGGKARAAELIWSRFGDCENYVEPFAGSLAVLLDPPYDVEGTDYGEDHTGLSTAVREWALANGDNPLMRIALCGYMDEGHELPGWECVKWRSGGGYNNLGDGQNRMRERIWFSPHCIPASQGKLFEVGK